MVERARVRAGHSVAIVVALLALLTLQTKAQTTTWYVGSGSDSSSCGAKATPCATIGYVLTNKAAAGHTIRVLPGSYTNQGSNINVNRANITITGDDPNNRPQLLNTEFTIPRGSTGVTISYLRIKARSAPFDNFEGVIDVGAYPTVIDHNELWSGAQGVLIRTSQQVTVSNNDIHDMGVPNTDYDGMCVLIVNRNNDPVPSGFANAIRITGNDLHVCGGDGMQENSWSEAGVQFNFLIMDNNRIYNNQEQGIDTKGTDDFRIYNNDIWGNGYGGISNNSVYGSTARWDIYNNRIHDHGEFAIFNQGGGSVWRIWNNLIYNNLRTSSYNQCAVTIPSDSASVFYNNTVVNNYDTSSSMSTCGISDKGNGNNVVNNIFYNNGTGSNDRGNIENISGEDGGTPNFNFVYPTTCGNGGQCKTGSNVKSTCLVSGNCPGFVNISGNDYHLMSNSPAVNAGTTLASTYALDIDSFNRSAPWDLGASEFGGATTPPPAAPTNVRIIR